jgi:hypothetical protein
LFEDAVKIGAAKTKAVTPPQQKPEDIEVEFITHSEATKEQTDLSDLSLKELRIKFPDIKDTSKTGFLEQLGQ